MSNVVDFDLSAAHEHFAKSTNRRAWELLSIEQRSIDEDFELEFVASASLYHWIQIALELQRGEWLLGRAYTVLGQAQAALRHAGRCLELTNVHKDVMKDFDRTYGFEGIARALALNGKKREAETYHLKAMKAGSAIVDEEDRKIFKADFERGDWYGVK